MTGKVRTPRKWVLAEDEVSAMIVTSRTYDDMANRRGLLG